MATKLQKLLASAGRGADPQDVIGAFLRLARRRWGERMPLTDVRFARGMLTIRCPSPLWRTEIVYSAVEFTDALQRDVPHASLQHLVAVLG